MIDFTINNQTTGMSMFRTSVIAAISTVLLAAGVRANDEVPGPPQTKPLALVNAVIHTVTGPPIENGTLVFDNGRITHVGRKARPPQNVKTIDLDGLHVYPGLIEAYSQIGLKEVSAVRASLDQSETGSVNPNVKAHVSVNPDSELIPVTRANGVLISVSAPSGGLISGQASVMQLDGWTWEDMTLKPSVGMIVNWPLPPASGESGNLTKLRELMDNARAYKAARAANGNFPSQQFDARLDALVSVIDKDMPLIARANDVRTIQSAVSFAVEQNVRVIVFGGYDAELCADLLKTHNVPVIIDSIHRTPRRRHEDYDASYTLPARLADAGVRFCISGYDRSSTWNARNLPYHAATAAAYGLSYEDAVRSVTIYPAEILGIDDRVGTLEEGKDATLIVTDGDPLETDTQVVQAWIQGRPVQLTSRHTRLNDKYTEKYRQQATGNRK